MNYLRVDFCDTPPLVYACTMCCVCVCDIASYSRMGTHILSGGHARFLSSVPMLLLLLLHQLAPILIPFLQSQHKNMLISDIANAYLYDPTTTLIPRQYNLQQFMNSSNNALLTTLLLPILYKLKLKDIFGISIATYLYAHIYRPNKGRIRFRFRTPEKNFHL